MDTKMKNRYYIAYGSNLNVAQMKQRCPDAKIVGTAELSGYELLFKGSKTGAYLTIEPKEGSMVPVAVWETSLADEDALDRYEGYPIFYDKREMELKVNGTKRDCYVYVMHEERQEEIPSAYYIQCCLEGYADFGFDPEILMRAVEQNWRNCHE